MGPYFVTFCKSKIQMSSSTPCLSLCPIISSNVLLLAPMNGHKYWVFQQAMLLSVVLTLIVLGECCNWYLLLIYNKQEHWQFRYFHWWENLSIIVQAFWILLEWWGCWHLHLFISQKQSKKQKFRNHIFWNYKLYCLKRTLSWFLFSLFRDIREFHA